MVGFHTGRFLLGAGVAIVLLIQAGALGFAQAEVGIKVSYPLSRIWGFELFSSAEILPSVVWESGFYPMPLQFGDVVAFSNLKLMAPAFEFSGLPWCVTAALGGTLRLGSLAKPHKPAYFDSGPQVMVGMEVNASPFVLSWATGIRSVERVTVPRLIFFEMGMRAQW